MELYVQMRWSFPAMSCGYFHRVPVCICACRTGVWLELCGGSAVHVRRILGAHEPHFSKPQPLNWENQSSSCRRELGQSCGKAGRRGRAHGSCLVLGWCWLRCGISDNVWLVHRCCNSWRSLGKSRRKYWHGVDSVWCRDVLCFQNNKNKSKGGG